VILYSKLDMEFTFAVMKQLHPRDPKDPKRRRVVSSSYCYGSRDVFLVLKLDCGHSRRVRIDHEMDVLVPTSQHCNKCK
jgi:hypothetical protein